MISVSKSTATDALPSATGASSTGSCSARRADEPELVWQSRDPFPHHDLSVAEDGTNTALIRKGRFHLDDSDSEPVPEDFLSVLNPHGEEIGRFLILDAFERTDESALPHDYRMQREAGDLLV
jgi:hypothetical protein